MDRWGGDGGVGIFGSTCWLGHSLTTYLKMLLFLSMIHRPCMLCEPSSQMWTTPQEAASGPKHSSYEGRDSGLHALPVSPAQLTRHRRP